jgi:sterol desaturase/sphingolipid hydroxylase (fatty acid hydroxylase superfamily)
MSQLLPDDMNLYLRWLVTFGLLTARYLLFAGGAYLIYYVIKRKDWLFMKIQEKFPDNKQVWTEVKYSFLTFLVFASVAVVIRLAINSGIVETKIYRRFAEHSVLYYIATTAILILFHDTYFYWVHRLMHHPLFYERVHKVHHLSKDPTPWAAFAFHPFEALLEIGFVPIIIFTLPLHFSSLLILSVWQILFNVMGHLGYETFPRNTPNNFLLKWLNTSTNHNMHHKYVRCNYGLYFSFWDKLMNTNHAKYYELFDEVTARREEGFRKLQTEEEEELVSVTNQTQ